MSELAMKLLCVLAVIIVTSNGQFGQDEEVQCRTDNICTPESFFNRNFPLTVEECCLNFTDAVAFRVPGLEPCFQCIVIGFNTERFVAIERDEPYTTELDFQVRKGIDEVFLAGLVYDIRVVPGGTATEGEDFLFNERRITANTNVPFPLDFTFFLDGIEREGNETFFIEAVLVSGGLPDNLFFFNRVEMTIIDGDFAISLGTQVNDTVIGDPLFTVPILVPEEDLQALNIPKLSLCYEIHGESDQWFNLVTDECTTVNAQYAALTPSLNIIDEIGVRAVDDNGQCVEILVDINNCSASVNGADLAVMERYSSGGVNMRRYSNRVRISVPNCAELTLVMWVTCERRSLDNPDDPGNMIVAEMIKFVIMRGLNFGHREAHGLLGQYWNVPVNVSQFDGLRQDGTNPQPSALVVNITTRGQTRGFAGWIADVTWDLSEGPCLYVGDKQGGPISEITEPGDGVIESLYKDYRVESAFSEENYGFGMFDESRCISQVTSPPL